MAMARKRKQTPPDYPRKPHNGQARITVTLATGKRHDLYLAKHASPESLVEYERLLALLRSNHGFLPTSGGQTPSLWLTINEIALRFWHHAQRHYRLRDGSPSRELEHFKYSFKTLLTLFGT